MRPRLPQNSTARPPSGDMPCGALDTNSTWAERVRLRDEQASGRSASEQIMKDVAVVAYCRTGIAKAVRGALNQTHGIPPLTWSGDARWFRRCTMRACGSHVVSR